MYNIPTAIVVDDDAETVSVFCEYLKILDVKVQGFGYNGKEAEELYVKFCPNIVFLDLVMPDYDGFYALEKIMQADPEANVVILTASHLDWYDQKRLEKLRPSKVILKPFDVDVVVELVDEHRKPLQRIRG
ncbi:response regulator [Candidatus Nitrosotenuis uzonensis]|uniref:Response regulator receiver protein n=1 Tax=Candidatus Nitrosotenuis uzonensis TaxID=1407055 RepID=A0A812F4H7_9ARCH|nr:response regulator [Candidatus Nitrosotenuis uzonensis]MCA2003680.1 response regulator [Candidatus Nitrosotenuis sp.]CAE6504684.1 Response regulator receiver protein [Candidatus Nitrosotenuis uzonensis]